MSEIESKTTAPEPTKNIHQGRIQYIDKSTLEPPHLWKYFGITKDAAGRFQPGAETKPYIHNYLSNIRPPSRKWPYSYMRAMLTRKFAMLVTEAEPALAIRLKVAEYVTDEK